MYVYYAICVSVYGTYVTMCGMHECGGHMCALRVGCRSVWGLYVPYEERSCVHVWHAFRLSWPALVQTGPAFNSLMLARSCPSAAAQGPTFLLGELKPREGEKTVQLKHHTHEESLKSRVFIWGSTKLLPSRQAALHPGLVCRVQRAQEGEETIMPSAEEVCPTPAPGSRLSLDTFP